MEGAGTFSDFLRTCVNDTNIIYFERHRATLSCVCDYLDRSAKLLTVGICDDDSLADNNPGGACGLIGRLP